MRCLLFLFLLTPLLIFPFFVSGKNLDNISIQEIEKHLRLPEKNARDLLLFLTKFFQHKWEELMSTAWSSPPYPTPEEMAVPTIMKKAIQVNTLDYFLIDVPTDIAWKIIKNTLTLSLGFLKEKKVLKIIFEKAEKESIKQANKYAMKILLQHEIKASVGTVSFEYELKKGGTGKAVLQYIMIYIPRNLNEGEALIRFFSPYYLEIPKSKGSWGAKIIMCTDLDHPLPPFIVDVQGEVKEFNWKDEPIIKISFPEEVPDLGIKPPSFWERHITKPIENRIKEVSALMKRTSGQKSGFSNIISKVKNLPGRAKNFLGNIKSFIVKHNPFGAEIAQNIPLAQPKEKPEPKEKTEKENIGQAKKIQEAESAGQERPQKKPKEKLLPKRKIISQAQEQIDDISEKIDVLNQKIGALKGKNNKNQGQEEQPQNRKQNPKKGQKQNKQQEENNEENQKQSREKEKAENLQEDKNPQKEEKTEKKSKLCKILPGVLPLRNKVIFNEIVWMGGQKSANDEWIELKNISLKDINLNNWQIQNKKQTLIIDFNNQTIPAKGFFLLERTDDKSVENIPADLIYKGAIKNSGEALFLFDENCRLQDMASAAPNWPAGDNKSKRTMERKENLAWQTSFFPGGTPKQKTGFEYSPVFTGSGAGASILVPSAPKHLKILISEVQVSPLQERFIELYNPNDKEVDLTGWYIQRKTKTAKDWVSLVSSTYFEGKKITGHSYFLIASSSQAEIIKKITLTEDNSIALKNPNREIVDILGWGNAQEYEISPAPSPGQGKSLGRKFSSTSQNYIDTNNNLADFEVQSPTPKKENQSLSNLLPLPLFTLSPQNPFVNEKVFFDASSSSDPDGNIVSYYWNFGDNSTSSASTTSHTFSSPGSFSVKLLLTDNSEATSSTSTAINVSQPQLAQGVVISEAQIKGNEFVEIYNASNTAIEISGWHLAYFSSNRDWNNPYRKAQFPSFEMAPESYFLIGLKDYSATGTSPEADWLIISTTIQLSNETGAIGIFYQDPSQFASSSQALEQKIDLLSWKESQNSQEPLVKETGSAIASSENQSLTRRQWQGSYIDTDNNSFDFEISQPGPVNSKGLPPQKITELKIASSSCNTIALSWPQGADPDTPTQELSYVVYYSRSAPLDENSLNASSTLSTTTASTTISLSDLYYNSNYYFGLKVFDGYNLSPLSNIASTSIDSALNDSPWPFWRQNLQRQGQNQYSGPNATPSVFWIYKKESSSKNPNNNPLYSPVVIKPEGAIIASVIYPQNKKGVLVLGPDGEKKWFSRDNEPGTYLKLLPDGSVASDNYSLAWSEDEMFYYLSQEDTLSAFDKQGNKQWERSFDFIMPQGQPCASTTPSLLPPLIGKDGKIYLVVKNNSCNSEYKLDYLYTISPENGSDFLEPISLGGYKSSLPAIGPNNTLYLFNLTYPKYSCQPKLWLRAVSNNSISWSKYFNNSFNSPPIVDSQGNLYFVIGKTLWAFNKNGEKLWDLYFGADLFSNWDKTDEIGISLSKKGTLYISGRGAILAIK